MTLFIIFALLLLGCRTLRSKVLGEHHNNEDFKPLGLPQVDGNFNISVNKSESSSWSIAINRAGDVVSSYYLASRVTYLGDHLSKYTKKFHFAHEVDNLLQTDSISSNAADKSMAQPSSYTQFLMVFGSPRLQITYQDSINTQSINYQNTLSGYKESDGSEEVPYPVDAYQYTHNESFYGSCHRPGYSHCSFFLKDHIFKGGHGEVWRAYKVVKEAPYSHPTTEQTPYILKRMYVQDNVFIKECSNREIYFGELFRDNSWANPPLVTTLIEHFVDRDSVWLVFKESGLSLQYLLYDYKHSHGAMIEPSKFWYKLRSDSKGPRFLKQLMFKIITEVHNLHNAGIVHRDIKPGNILIEVSEDAITHKSKLNVIISDFSSAYHNGIDIRIGMPLDRPEYANLTTRTDLNDAERLARASSADEISLSQLSLEYAPPEVRLFPTFCNYESRGDCNMSSDSSAQRKACLPKHSRGLMSSYDTSYDVWSIGVTFMEIILAIHGSKQGNDIFSVGSSRQSIILQRIRTLFRKRHLDSKAEDLTFSKKKCHNFLNDLHDGEIGTVSRSVFAAALSDYCIMHTNLVQLPSANSLPTHHDVTDQSPQAHTSSPLLPAPSSQLLLEETATISQPVATLEITPPVSDVCSAATALVPFPILIEESSSTSATSRLIQLIDNFEMALVVSPGLKEAHTIVDCLDNLRALTTIEFNTLEPAIQSSLPSKLMQMLPVKSLIQTSDSESLSIKSSVKLPELVHASSMPVSTQEIETKSELVVIPSSRFLFQESDNWESMSENHDNDGYEGDDKDLTSPTTNSDSNSGSRSNNNYKKSKRRRDNSDGTSCGLHESDVEAFRSAIVARDEEFKGLYLDEAVVDLLMKLLSYDPRDRITLLDALKHDYFKDL